MGKYTYPVKKIPTVRKKLGIYTIPDMLDHICSKYSNNIALSTKRESNLIKYSYGELYRNIRVLARFLKECGLDQGDHIGVLGENSPEWAISYFSIVWIGAVSIPIDAKSSISNIKNIIQNSNCKAIFISEHFLKEVKEIQEESNHLKKIILIESIKEIFNKYSDGIPQGDVKKDDLSDIIFTSGTTGNPKGVMLTHYNIMSNVEDIYSILEITPEDKAFSVLPIHHSYERTGGLMSTLFSGMEIYYTRSLRPNILLDDLLSQRPTIWLNTPLLLEKLLIKINKEISSLKGFKKIITNIIPRRALGISVKKKLGLDNIKLIVSGGAKLPVWVSNGYETLGFPLVQGYGLTETSPLISANPPSNPKNESVGMVIPSVDVEIRNLDNEGNGEIYVKGPNVMKGYYKNETATNEILDYKGWLNTGDVGYFDDEGYLYITGRKKNTIVTPGGKNIFPEEIEEKLTESGYIEEAMVISPDDEQVQAILYLNEEEIKSKLKQEASNKDDYIIDLIDSEIREINKSLEGYKRIRNFAIRREEFPKTTTRKIKRHEFDKLKLHINKNFL